MRNCQPAKNNPFWLPHHLYMQTLYLVRDYDRLKTEYDNILDTTPDRDWQPRRNQPSDPTGQAAVKRIIMGDKIRAIDAAMEKIPPEYRRTSSFRNPQERRDGGSGRKGESRRQQRKLQRRRRA